MSLIGKKIASHSNGRFRSIKTKNRGIRLVSTDIESPPDNAEIIQILQNASFVCNDIVHTSDPRAVSKKYCTYLVQDQNSQKDYKVVFGLGKNCGEKYEQDLFLELKNCITGQQSWSRRGENLLKSIGVNNIEDILDITSEKRRRHLRNFSTEIGDVGEEIADFTLYENNKIHHISLKDTNGYTFANIGIGGAFIHSNKADGQHKITKGDHNFYNFLSSLGVDIDCVLSGFSHYLNKDDKNFVIEKRKNKKEKPQNPNYSEAEMYLSAMFGKGYHYVKNKGRDEFFVISLATDEDVLKTVGKINDIEIYYPGLSKQVTVNIKTDFFKFVVEIRNSSGGIIPKEVKIRMV